MKKEELNKKNIIESERRGGGEGGANFDLSTLRYSELNQEIEKI